MRLNFIFTDNVHILCALSVVLIVFNGVLGDRYGRDRLVVGLTTTCAISDYHH